MCGYKLKEGREIAEEVTRNAHGRISIGAVFGVVENV
jgi:hypothetical protein